MSIQEHLDRIRNAIYGREVRESIAKGIETAYDDASEKDNANMEVKIARGTHPNLRSRLDETTAQLAQKVGLGTKAELEDLSGTVLSAIEGGEGTTFNLLSIPQDKSVTKNKLSVDILQPPKNLFDKEAREKGRFLIETGTTGTSPSSGYDTTAYIPVVHGDYAITKPRKVGVYSGTGGAADLVDFYDNPPMSNLVVTITEGQFLRASFHVDDVETAQIEFNNQHTSYVPYTQRTLGSDIKVSTHNFSEEINGKLENHLANKHLLVFGDSIAFGSGNPIPSQLTGSSATGIGELIAERNSMTVRKMAVGGATVSVFDGSTNNIPERVNLALSNGYTADYIVFNGLTNDISNSNRVKGTISSGFDATLDTTTFCGAFEWLCKTMKENWPYAKIIYFRPHNMDSREYDLQVEYGNTALEICEKWSIPVVDLFKESGLNTHLAVMKNNYTNNADGTHPNADGYNKFYIPLIETKMKAI